MSEPSSTLGPTSTHEHAAWDDAEWLESAEPTLMTALEEPQQIAPRALLPEPRRFSEPVTNKPEGLRIEPRAAIRLPGEGEAPPSRKIEITEHGKGIIRLESEPPVLAVARLDVLPLLQPRNAKPLIKQSKFSAEWGKADKHSHRWLWWSAGGILTLVLVGLAIQPLLINKDQNRTADSFRSIQVVEDVVAVEDPTVYFSENPAQVLTEIQDSLGKYARARSSEEALPMIRHGTSLKEELSKHWKPWPVPGDWAVSDDAAITYDSVGKIPYAIVGGTLPDFSAYRVFLVREQGRMLVDWEATLGLGTRTFMEMRDPAIQAAELRVVMTPVGFYSLTFPEVRYCAYRLDSSADETSLWGYVERGSPAALALEEIFNEKAIFSDKPREQMVRLRLKRGAPEAASNQWLVMDVLHKGWVTP
ncbi:MAG: hypothetical protein WCH40_00485 [Verrucomicrobiales bacterium]